MIFGAIKSLLHVVFMLQMVATSPHDLKRHWKAQQECAKVQPALEKWQEALNMTEHKITIECRDQKPGEWPYVVLGGTIPYAHDKTAHILINPYSSMDSGVPVERTVIHELMHIKLDFAKEAKSDVVDENFVEDLEALIYDTCRD